MKNKNKDEIISEILIEQERRKNLEVDAFERQESIKKNYSRLYPEIFDFKVIFWLYGSTRLLSPWLHYRLNLFRLVFL